MLSSVTQSNVFSLSLLSVLCPLLERSVRRDSTSLVAEPERSRPPISPGAEGQPPHHVLVADEALGVLCSAFSVCGPLFYFFYFKHGPHVHSGILYSSLCVARFAALGRGKERRGKRRGCVFVELGRSCKIRFSDTGSVIENVAFSSRFM